MFVAYDFDSGYSDESMRFATLKDLSQFFLDNPDNAYFYRRES